MCEAGSNDPISAPGQADARVDVLRAGGPVRVERIEAVEGELIDRIEIVVARTESAFEPAPGPRQFAGVPMLGVQLLSCGT